MAAAGNSIDLKWVEKQTNEYRRRYGKYKRYAEVLENLLKGIAKTYDLESIIHTRPKAIASFAEKVVRKSHKYRDPVNQLTDLCGGRVITQTQSEVTAFCRLVEEHFLIDWENSVGLEDRLKPTEFGYRSVHYIIRLNPDYDYKGRYSIEVPATLFELYAEIQVRTILEHAWADLYHRWVYKNEFEIPAKMQREMAGIAARLEAADNSFSGVQEGLKEYYTTYGAYLNREQSLEEIEKLEITLKYDPGNISLVRQTGRLHVALENWDKVIEVLSPFEKKNDPVVLRFLGLAYCKKHKKDVKHASYAIGQDLLLKAGSPPYNDPDALASLAGSWKGIDDNKSNEYYKMAFGLDPTDAYPLSNYLASEILKDKNLSVIGFTKPVIDRAIERSHACIEVDVNIPWAWYNLGKLQLFLNDPYASLSAYSRAIEVSTAAFMPETSLESLIRLKEVREQLPGYTWIRHLLLLGLAARFSQPDALNEIRKNALQKIPSPELPVLIMAGGSSHQVQQKMEGYRQFLAQAFKGVKCILISGGTKMGISQLAGDLKEQYPGDLYTIGYLPGSRKEKADDKRSRYDEIRTTEGEDYSPLEATHYWMDIIASGIHPDKVKLLVINGGTISTSECRMALVMGARVGILEGSGGEPSQLLSDEHWGPSRNLVQLPDDPAIVHSFLKAGASPADETLMKIRETLAIAIHEQYRQIRMKKPEGVEPSLESWKNLDEGLKLSNLLQADQIFEKLKMVGCGVRKVTDREVALMKFTKKEIEQMAEMEHARWTVERLNEGWKPAREKNVAKKLSPFLIAWDQLSEEIKDYDRSAVSNIPAYLAKEDMEVYRIV
jgi:ppGpp synthetase/RelA/SpoT-type nucleotidyltranferase